MIEIPYSNNMEYKMVILVRKDLKMSKGKIAAQVAHAAVGRVMSGVTTDLTNWYNEGQKKVVLGVDSQTELEFFCSRANDEGIACVVIRDAGRTEVEPGTMTCASFGPFKSDSEKDIFTELKPL